MGTMTSIGARISGGECVPASGELRLHPIPAHRFRRQSQLNAEDTDGGPFHRDSEPGAWIKAPPPRTFRERVTAFARSPLKGKVRRAYLAIFRKAYVRAQMDRRRGACRQCGRCCRLLYRCMFLTDDNRCLIYHKPRAANCELFPIDARDLENVQRLCGFYFEDSPGRATPGARTPAGRDTALSAQVNGEMKRWLVSLRQEALNVFAQSLDKRG